MYITYTCVDEWCVVCVYMLSSRTLQSRFLENMLRSKDCQVPHYTCIHISKSTISNIYRCVSHLLCLRLIRIYSSWCAARDAMCWFVKLWSSLELFGMEFLSCTNNDTKENGLIGISKDRVSLLYQSLDQWFCIKECINGTCTQGNGLTQ